MRLLNLVAYIALPDVENGLENSGGKPGGGQSSRTSSSRVNVFSAGGPFFDMLAGVAGGASIAMKRAGARPTMRGEGKLAEYARTQKTYGGVRNDNS